MVYLGPVDLFADERELCEAWFQPALIDEDREWIRRHLELIGKQPPSVDISWLKMEQIR